MRTVSGLIGRSRYDAFKIMVRNTVDISTRATSPRWTSRSKLAFVLFLVAESDIDKNCYLFVSKNFKSI